VLLAINNSIAVSSRYTSVSGYAEKQKKKYIAILQMLQNINTVILLVGRNMHLMKL